MAVWAEIATATEPKSYTVLYTVCYVRDVDLDSKHPTEHNVRKPGGLLGMLHPARSKEDKVSLGCCFQSLSYGFILQIYSMLHILNLASSNFPRSPSK